jgi:hypothetical protein
MMIKRMFAGSIVVLLLAASSLAAACDLSCSFALMSSDCHSLQAESQDSAAGAMTVDGMAMAEMTMPEMANSESQLAVSAISRSNWGHPSIGEMGPCEKQACDNGAAVSVKTARSVNSQIHSISAVTEIPRAYQDLRLFRDARDAITAHRVLDESPLHSSLRI